MRDRGDLRSLLERAVSYKSWPAPMDEGLRRAALFGGLTTLAGLAFMVAIPALHRMSVDSSLIMRRQLVSSLESLARHSPLWGALNVTTLGIYLFLLIVTRGWLKGRPRHHWAAWAMAVVGAMISFIVALEIGLLALNLVILLLVGLVLILVLFFWLTGNAAR